MPQPPRVIVLSGPGGVGKTTIANELLRQLSDQLTTITKLTSRQPREGERDGDEFHFLSDQDFLGAIQRGELLEYNLFNGHYYGVPKQALDAALASGKSPLLVVDVNGARAIQAHYPDRSLLIFLSAPFDQLRNRYIRRGHDEQEADQRLKIALEQELPQASWYDAIIENHENNLAKAVDAIVKLIRNQ